MAIVISPQGYLIPKMGKRTWLLVQNTGLGPLCLRRYLGHGPQTWFTEGIQKVPKRWQMYINSDGEYCRVKTFLFGKKIHSLPIGGKVDILSGHPWFVSDRIISSHHMEFTGRSKIQILWEHSSSVICIYFNPCIPQGFNCWHCSECISPRIFFKTSVGILFLKVIGKRQVRKG